MSLVTAHRILIASAVGFFAFYGLWELAGFRSSGEAAAVVRALLALAAALGFALYFRTIETRYRRGVKGSG